MATTIVMPQMGYDMREGKVVKWLKKEGDEVQRGEAIAEIETDKAVVEMESTASGVLRKIVVAEGESVPVGQPIAIVGAPDEEIPEVSAPSAPSAEAPTPEQAPASATSAPAPAAPAPPGRVRATPVARRLAREHGIDLTQVKGTGPGGRITEKDVLAYIEQAKAAPAPATAPAEAPPAPAPAPAPPAPPPPGLGERIELTRMRQAVASVVSRSKREIPHFYVTVEIEMDRALELRQEVNEALGGEHKVSVNDLVILAAVKSLLKHPKFNATFQGDHLVVSPSINIGVAVALPEGLIIPSLRDCQNRSLLDISRGARDLAERARQNRLRAEELTGATFTVSNMGMFGVDEFSAVIFPPNAAILAVGQVKERPVVKDGQVTVARVMKATISVDHRVADGAEAARFMQDLRNFLEHPALMLI